MKWIQPCLVMHSTLFNASRPALRRTGVEQGARPVGGSRATFAKRGGRPVLQVLLLALFSVVPAAAATLDYQTDVAPLLRDYCAGCHNDFDLEGDFSVETFASLMKGGESDDKTILVPGKPAESYLLQTIHGTAKPVMPPKKEPQLSADEVAIIERWITEGAKGPAEGEDLSILSTLNVPDIAATGEAPEPITAMAVSPDGKTVAVARYGSVELRNRADGKAISTIAIDDGKANAIHFSPDGKLLSVATGITGLKGVAALFDVATGEPVRRIGEDSHRDILFDAEFSPDGTLLATAGYDRVIRLWETATGKYLRQFPSHNGAVFDLAFSPDGGTLASASADSTCKIWDVASGERLDTLNQPQGEQFRVAFTPDSRHIVAVGADNRIRLWRFVSNGIAKINPIVHARFGHEDEIVEMAISDDGKSLLTTSADRALKRWTLPGLQLAEVLPPQPDVVAALGFLEADKFVAARLDGSYAEIAVGSGKAVVADKVPDASEEPVSATTMAAQKIEVAEAEGGDPAALPLGAVATGTIGVVGDTDDFVFEARKGERWIFEVDAARSKSPLDSHLAILDSAGEPVEQAVLQAVRDSWLTFRGKDSTESGDFRVHNWMEMELDEFLYVNGEVVRLWHYPRGPDSGFLVYPGFGTRHNFFGTTALAHPLGQPCYIVRALPAGTEPSPNGLPVYRLYYENDDDPARELGSDSKVDFTAPADGSYRIRIRDVRGFGGEGYAYKLAARAPMPGFSVSVGGKNPKISPGSAREVAFTAKRIDGYTGPIEIEPRGLPAGLSMPEKIVIEANQFRAFAPVSLASGVEWKPEMANGIELVARAEIAGKTIEHKLGNLGKVEQGEAAKVLVRIEPDGESGKPGTDGVLEFTVAPGETVTARVVAQRLGHEDRIDFGKEDSGRNLPYGLYIDNIGLNGLMIPQGKDEQRFFVTASPISEDTERLFHLRATVDGNQVSAPVRIIVRKKDDKVSAR